MVCLFSIFFFSRPRLSSALTGALPLAPACMHSHLADALPLAPHWGCVLGFLDLLAEYSFFLIMDETQPRPLWCGRIRNMQNAWSCLAEIENFRWPSNLFRCFWRLCVPILYHGLMAFFIQLRVPSFWWRYVPTFIIFFFK